MLEEQTVKKLIKCALRAEKIFLCTVFQFCVGAALLAENGTVYTGCNIENGAYSPSNCAENCIFKAVSEGVKISGRSAS